jgi:2-hydroxychromene-2-carboxylate isomerase
MVHRQVGLLSLERVFRDPYSLDQVLQVAPSAGIADRTVEGMVDQQEFEGFEPHLLHALRARVNHHPSTTGVAQEATGISAPSTSTKQIRQDLIKLNLAW